MKWIFFLIVLGVLVYMAYSTRFAFLRQFSSSISHNDSIEKMETSEESEARDPETEVELESNILNTMQRIKKQ